MQGTTFGIGRRCTLWVVLACSMSAQAQEIRWYPATASDNVVCLPGTGACGDTEIILSSGGAQVTLFIEVSDWDSFGGGHPGDVWFYLGSVEATVDSSTYAGGVPGNPGTVAGVDLIPVGSSTGNMGLGAFHAVRVCGNTDCLLTPSSCLWDPFSDCGSNQGSTSCSAPLSTCIDRPDFVYDGVSHSSFVSVATSDYLWFTASTECKEDSRDGSRFYAGTLILEIPSFAKGTYNIDFDSSSLTALNSCPGPMFPGLIRTAGQITIQTGKCCYDLGAPQCVDGISEGECESLPGPRLFSPGETCASACPGSCTTVADCDDSDPCTTDVCVSSICAHTDVSCDDGNSCTEDICDSAEGCVNSSIPGCGGGSGACCTLTACTNVSSAGACSGTFLPGASCSTVGLCGSASGTIGPAGGTIETPDGTASVDFPAGCVSSETAMSIEFGNWPDRIFDVLVTGGPGRTLASYTFEPSGSDFCDTAELCLTVNLAGALLTADDCESVEFQHREGRCAGSPGTECHSDGECGGVCNFTFTAIPLTSRDCTDPSHARFCANIGHFSDYGLVGPDSGSIPTVSEWGLIALTLILLVGAKIYFGRRRRAA